jgi:uncharacterized protein (TIGR03437 family)
MGIRTYAGGVLLACLLATHVAAQADRILGPIDARSVVELPGNSNPRARPELDRGPVDPALLLDGVTLNFQPSPAQQDSLRELLRQQQDPSAANFHKWLQPSEFAGRFGLSPGDVAKIAAWAQSQGLRVEYQANTRTWMRLSGSAAQVERALHVQLRRYQVDGELHFANAGPPSVPAALQPLLSTIRGLDDFFPKPPRRTARPVAEFNSSNGAHYLFPADLWTIYDINPLLNAGYNGAGQKLVVVGQANVDLGDVRTFRNQTGLPANDPVIIQGGSASANPAGQLGEIDLDLEWAGGIAPNATLYYVYANDSFSATQYAIDQNYAPVISSSYGECEAQVSVTGLNAQFFELLAMQANAMGITWVAASGDQGAAGCDTSPTASTAVNGLAVDMPASIPEVTGVGGTTFNDSSGGYWSSSNNSATGGSALKYIPEGAWNDESITGRLSSSGGGASALYAKPSWQSAPGVPNDGARDVPDVAFAASPNHTGYAVVQGGQAVIVGGTSAATPVFAAMLVLLNQYLVASHVQSKAGLGNVNPTLYRLARSSANVFHDITSGSNIVPCAINTPNCTSGNLGWAAGPGYDLVTGLGSLDLANLAAQWFVPTSAALTFSAAPATIVENSGIPNCPFPQYLMLQETNGFAVDLTRFFGGSDYTSSILTLFGSLRVPPFGSLPGVVCWTGVTPPSTTTLEMDGIDSLGNTVSARTGITFQSPAGSAGSLAASPLSLVLNASGATTSASGSINLAVPAGQQWAVTASPAGPLSDWLKISPQSGTGPAQINITASAAGVKPGAYSANLVFQSANTSPQFFVTNVIFVVGASQSVKISAVANAASFQQAAAPGMYLSIFGSGLAPAGTNIVSSSSPIPFSMAGISATINGIPAAVEYASPTQVNVLVPLEIPAGQAVLALNNNGQVASYAFPVSLAAPGIFVDGNGYLAGAANAARGAEIAFFITGQGDVSPAIASNTAVFPPAALPKPLLPVSVTIGGAQATVAYAGLPYYFEGISQINVFVPTAIGTGAQQVVVTVGGINSVAAKINVTN